MLLAENALELTKINKNNNMNNGIVERTPPLSVLYTDIYKSRVFFFNAIIQNVICGHQELQDK